jgi:hypothetical protein
MEADDHYKGRFSPSRIPPAGEKDLKSASSFPFLWGEPGNRNFLNYIQLLKRNHYLRTAGLKNGLFNRTTQVGKPLTGASQERLFGKSIPNSAYLLASSTTA